MTTSTEADSDTTPGTDLDGGVATDQPGTNSTPPPPPPPPAPPPPGSNLWGLINGRGLLLEFTNSDPALDQQLAFGNATVEMLGGYSVSNGILQGMSGGARFVIGLVIAIHLLLIAACAVAFVRFIAAIRPNRTGFVDHLFTRGGHLFWLLHRVYQRAGRLAAENTVLREETEGLV